MRLATQTRAGCKTIYQDGGGDEGQGEGGALAGVGVGPGVGHHFAGGVGGVFQRVVGAVEAAGGDVVDFAADGDHCLAEPIELGLGFAFGGLDHQGAGHGPGHRGGVEAEILQALGDVFDLDAAISLKAAAVDDAFMRHHARGGGVEDGIVRGQGAGDVVGVEDRDLAGAGEACGAHHADIGVADRQDEGAAEGGGGNRAVAGGGAGVGAQGVVGQEGHEMRGDADRAHAGAAAAMGNAEGFVQIEVADIGADEARAGEADLGVHVGAVHVHLAAGVVDDAADIADVFLEHAVGAGIGDHEGGEFFGVGGGFFREGR